MSIALWASAAFAVDPPADSPPPTEPATPEVAERLSALEAQVAALQAELEAEKQAALLREAEALANASPPPPPPTPTAASAFNPALTAFGDALVTVGVQDGEVLPGSGPWLRSLELDLRASVDPFATAVAVLAVEQEPPELARPDAPAEPAEPAFSVGPEELYLDFVALPAGFSVRAGGFRQPFGITNRAHPHDYPWADTPLPLTELLGEEGLNEVGAVVSWHVPNKAGIGLTFDAGVNAGERFEGVNAVESAIDTPSGGTTLAVDDPPTAIPAWIGRAELFHDFGDVELAVGASGTGLPYGAGAQVVGGDLMLRWRGSSWRSVLFVAEALSDLDGGNGAYAAFQLQPTRPLYLGLRGDWLTLEDLDAPTLLGTAVVSYYTSEFLRFRGSVSIDPDLLLTTNLQLTFVWGSHPVEPYWVNR